jgi:hypothetical protein
VNFLQIRTNYRDKSLSERAKGDRFKLMFCFIRFHNAKKLVVSAFIVVLCICWGCSPSVCRNFVPTSREPLVHAFIELFEDANLETRMEAYFLSVGLPDIPELERILRQRRNSPDQFERIIASYALAAMTREPRDIDAFLDIFPDEPLLFLDIMDAEWTLSGTFNTGMADFLLLLAYEPRTREKALPHLARIICNMPGELESMNTYFADPLVRTYIDRHLDDARLDDKWFNADSVCTFGRTDMCKNKLTFLIQHADMASKITAMMMTRRMWLSDNLLKIIRTFQNPPHDSIYRYFLMFDDDVESFSRQLCMDKNMLICILYAEKELYRPPLRGIVGTLWHQQSFDDQNRRHILRILKDTQQYGKTWLEICEEYRLRLL